MLSNNRVIDQGYGNMHRASVGLKVGFTTAVDLFPVNDVPETAPFPEIKMLGPFRIIFSSFSEKYMPCPVLLVKMGLNGHLGFS
jgi:hypothetical protein